MWTDCPVVNDISVHYRKAEQECGDCPVVNDISVHYRKAQQECGQIVPLLMILLFITGRLNKNVDRLSRC